MGQLSQVYFWVLANWAQLQQAAAGLAIAVLGLISAASVLIKALEVAVALLVKFWPKLQSAEGKLQGAAAWLDALGKSGFLNKIALSPKSATNALLAALASMMLLAPKSAFAQDAGGCLGMPKLHCGVSASLLEYKLGSQGAFSPGVGPELDWHFAKWNLGAALLGVGSLPISGPPSMDVKLAVLASLGSYFGPLNGASLGPDLTLWSPSGDPALVKGFTWKGSVGLVFSASPDLLSGLQASPK